MTTPIRVREVARRTLTLSLDDQLSLLAFLGSHSPVFTGWQTRLTDQLRANLRDAERDLPRRLTEFDEEPPPGSVIMTQGLGGTAWQRSYADGMWTSGMNDAARTWDDFDMAEFGASGDSRVWLILEGQPR